jgi:probable HAF family extracellular repeat protein
MRIMKVSILCLALVLGAICTSAAKTPVFHFVQCPGMPQTSLRGISNNNVAVGACSDYINPAMGFILADGKLTPLNHPDAVNGTYPEDVNSSGTVVGFYYEADFNPHAFKYEGGRFSDIGPPNATQTLAYGVDDLGRIAGAFVDSNGIDAGWILDGATYRIIRTRFLSTAVHDITVTNMAVMFWQQDPPYFVSSGCTLSGCTKIKVPNAVDVIARGIDSAGDIVLSWSADGYSYHGAVIIGKRLTSFDTPGCDSTTAWRINDNHVVVGVCKNSSGLLGYYVGF